MKSAQATPRPPSCERERYPIGPLFADFACIEAGLMVEPDGNQHGVAQAIAADLRRTAVLDSAGLHVLRYTDREVVTERDAVLSRIFEWLQAHHTHLNPLPQAEEGEMPRTSP